MMTVQLLGESPRNVIYDKTDTVETVYLHNKGAEVMIKNGILLQRSAPEDADEAVPPLPPPKPSQRKLSARSDAESQTSPTHARRVCHKKRGRRSSHHHEGDKPEPHRHHHRREKQEAFGADVKDGEGEGGLAVSHSWVGHWKEPAKKGYEGHPERDSLDGNLPGSGPGTGDNKRRSAGGSLTEVSQNPAGGAGHMMHHHSHHMQEEDRAEKERSKKLMRMITKQSDQDDRASAKGDKGAGGGGGTLTKSEGKLSRGLAALSLTDVGGYREKKHPQPWMWANLSSMYGKIMVILALVFCLSEVVQESTDPPPFQDVFLMYLYVGSIGAIMCFYISVLVDQFPLLTASQSELVPVGHEEGDPEIGSTTSTLQGGWGGTLRRAHISRSRISRSSFYLRIGAIVFGLGTLVFACLEVAMHSTMDVRCVNDLTFAHPILQALFTFLQMHFLFVNSQAVVERWGGVARFGLIHLVATNLTVWIRLVLWEGANEWIRTLSGEGDRFKRDTSSLVYSRSRQYPHPYPRQVHYGAEETYSAAASVPQPSTSCNCSGFVQALNATTESSVYSHLLTGGHAQRVVELYECLSSNTIGQIWTKTLPYLYPFIVEYSLIAAAVTYVMWKNVGRAKDSGERQQKLSSAASSVDESKSGHWRVDCHSSSKGLFLGLLCLVAGIVVIIIHYVLRTNEEKNQDLYYMYSGSQIGILGLSILISLVGFIQIPTLSLSPLAEPTDLDKLLGTTTISGVYIFSLFGLVVGVADPLAPNHLLLWVLATTQLVQVTLQSMLLTDAMRRKCSTRKEMKAKPGRQVITFLLFANVTLWLLDSFTTRDQAIAQSLQSSYYGFLLWAVISRISLPLMIFYRFYSSVALIEIWKNTYKTKTA